MKPILIYDGSCAFCRGWAERLKRLDHQGLFIYRAQTTPLDSLHLEESNGQIWTQGRALFRFFWLLGGGWKWVGWVCWVPVFPDLIYRLIARNFR